MIETNCMLCGSREREKLFNQEGIDPYLSVLKTDFDTQKLNWFKCRECELIYRSPKLEPHEIKHLYDNYDNANPLLIDDNEYFDEIIQIPDQFSENAQKINWVSDIFCQEKGSLRDKISILDVGCGAGTLLYTAGQKFKTNRLFGVEPNKRYANICIERVTKDVVTDEFSSNQFQQTFDLVMNAKVLEHIDDPRPFLKELAAKVSEHTLLFLEVPDASEVNNLSPNDNRFFIPHIYFYSNNTLQYLLDEQGLSIIASRVYQSHRNRTYLQVICERPSDK